MPAPDDIVTLRLDGEVSIDHFATAVNALDGLLKSLSSEITGSPASVRWRIVELSASSAVTTIRGTAEDPTDVPPIITAYSIIGQALQNHSDIPYSEDICRRAASIASLVNGEITAIHFTSPRGQHIVREPPKRQEETVAVDSFGAVEGRIRTLSDRQNLKFMLYDSLFDSAVTCFLSPEKADEARRLWRERVVVEGIVRRDPHSGIPTQIRNIRAIHKMPSAAPGSYREARGALRNVANS